MATPIFWFILGREPHLSAAEITAIFGLPGTTITCEPPILRLQGVAIASHTINRLGGTIKIAREIMAELPKKSLNEELLKYLRSQTGKIIFGLSWYVTGKNPPKSVSELEKIGKHIKKQLQEEGRSVRYIPNREPILSSVTVDKNGLTRRGAEIIIFDNGSPTVSLAQTIAVQPFEAFSDRDFGRPGRDDKSGMLPPKLALMMINIAQLPPGGTLLDPFCGSGTIITEALLTGAVQMIGTDISDKAIDDTKRNLTWIKERHSHIAATPTIYAHDARTLDDTVQISSIDAIVTEPFLGRPLTGKEPPNTLNQHLRELQPLYEQSLNCFSRLLKPRGTIVIIVPRYRTKTGWLTIPFIDIVNAAGLHADRLGTHDHFLLYARPTHHVGREIWRLRTLI